MGIGTVQIINGDVIQAAIDGQIDVLLHGCNCQCVMGAGIARKIRDTWPAVYLKDQSTIAGSIDKLGTIDSVNIFNTHLTIVNCYTQFFYGRDPGILYADYNAIRSCFKAVNDEFVGRRIGMPAIGCGLAGGDFNTVHRIAKEEFINANVTIFTY